MSISGEEFSIHQQQQPHTASTLDIAETTSSYVGNVVNSLVSSLSVPEDRLITTIGEFPKLLWILLVLALLWLLRCYLRHTRIRHLEATKKSLGYID